MRRLDLDPLAAAAGVCAVVAAIVITLEALIDTVTGALAAAFAAVTAIATTALICVAAVAGLAVVGWTIREIARIRVGGDIEALKHLESPVTNHAAPTPAVRSEDGAA